uniref:Secreted protein n=1 Tax=Vespula pensylvanica TaxID=30213 RepID=A0A834NXC8_VESPE|nr:hypothetical protein H0235_010552 [Vespula pensylvanica]
MLKKILTLSFIVANLSISYESILATARFHSYECEKCRRGEWNFGGSTKKKEVRNEKRRRGGLRPWDNSESYGPSMSRSNILANLCPIKINQTPSRSAVFGREQQPTAATTNTTDDDFQSRLTTRCPSLLPCPLRICVHTSKRSSIRSLRLARVRKSGVIYR